MLRSFSDVPRAGDWRLVLPGVGLLRLLSNESLRLGGLGLLPASKSTGLRGRWPGEAGGGGRSWRWWGAWAVGRAITGDRSAARVGASKGGASITPGTACAWSSFGCACRKMLTIWSTCTQSNNDLYCCLRVLHCFALCSSQNLSLSWIHQQILPLPC